MSNVLELTCELLKRKSVTPEDGGCLQLVLEFLGPDFRHEWFNFADTKNLLISHGNSAPHLMFLGHVDVVPAGAESDWLTEPFHPVIKDGKLYARGASDMKSGVASIAVALKEFVAKNPNHIGTVSYLLTSDEEGTNANAIPKVVEEFKKRDLRIDYCITGEPSSKDRLADNLKIGRRGTLSGNLLIYGTQGHIAYPQLADNPIHSFAPILTKLTQHRWDQGDEFFAPTSLQFSNISAGTGATNIIPGTLNARFNFRFSPSHSPESLMKEFEAILESVKIKYDITWALGGLPFLTKKGKLIEACTECIKSEFGIDANLDTSGGTSDARFIAPLGTEVVELGVRGETMHKINEFVRVEELEPLAALYQKITAKILV